MAIHQEFLLELKDRNDIESVIGGYVNLRRRGSNLVGLCPFHNEKTPSFTVYPENGSYFCFGCGAGGDVITFIRQAENLDYIEAVRLLAERAGLTMPEDGFDTSMQKLKSVVLAINREAARYFYSLLMSAEGREALEYLTGRGLAPATIRRFGLGFSPAGWDGLLLHLRGKGFADEDILQADLIVKGKKGGYYDRFRGRVMFPIIDIRGTVIGFGGRVLPGAEGAKYINSGDTPVFKKSRNMYALNFAKATGGSRMILAEGYMDVISLHQAGFTNAVAALGTAFTGDQARLLRRYTKEVVVTLDADAAGQKATDRAIGILTDAGLSVRVLRIPDGKDPDEFIKKSGASRFEALLEGAVNDIEYQLYQAGQGMDLNTDDGRLAYLKRSAEILAGIEDAIARDLYAGRLADRFGVSKAALLSETEHIITQSRKKQAKKQLREIMAPPLSGQQNSERRRHLRAWNAEEALLSNLIMNPDYCDFVEQRITAEQFVTNFHRRVFSAVTGLLHEGQIFDLSLLSRQFSPEEMGMLAAIQNRVNTGENAKTELTDCIGVILEEKEKLESAGTGAMSDSDWAEQIKKIAEKKQRGL